MTSKTHIKMDQKKNSVPNWLKFTIGAIIIFVIIGIVAGDDKKGETNTASSSSATENAPAPPTENAITISSSELINAYQNNEVAADNKFKGKRLIVSGVIEDIGKDILDKPYIVMSKSDALRGVQCSFEDANVVAGFQKGQKVTIKGTCNGLMMNVQLDDVTLVN